MNLLKASPSILFVMAIAIACVMSSCDKEDATQNFVSTIIGTWDFTTFQVSDCAREGENVEMRDCGFSDSDDLDCGILEFRLDGRYVEDGEALEFASNYTISDNMLTLVDQDNETYTFRFEVSDDAMTLYHDEFNGVGCKLAANLVRVR